MILERFIGDNKEYEKRYGCQTVSYISLGELRPETAVKQSNFTHFESRMCVS